VTDFAILIGLGVVAVLLVVWLVLSTFGQRRAEQRAAALVRQLLSDAELRQLDELGYLDVRSRSTPSRIYRVPATPGRVTVFESGVPIVRLCLQPTRGIPNHEHVLVHKLLLEGAEDDYCARANHMTEGLWRWQSPTSVELWTGYGPGVLHQQ
jgi:hypothetical protein